MATTWWIRGIARIWHGPLLECQDIFYEDRDYDGNV